MKTFNHVLPHRDEITVELLEGNVVQLTQANPSLDQPDQIKSMLTTFQC